MRGTVRLVAPVALVVARAGARFRPSTSTSPTTTTRNTPTCSSTRRARCSTSSTRSSRRARNSRRATRLGSGRQPDYWPLPWYLRDNPNAAFWGYLQNESTNNLDTPQPLVLSNVNQRADVEAAIADTHTRVGTYTLRPGVELDLWVQSNPAGG